MPEKTSPQSCHTPETNLTRSQLLIWTGQQLNPGVPLYNMAMAFELKGHLDIDRFKKALQKVINACDALRTVVEEQEGVPQQKVLAALQYDSEVLDWTNQPSADALIKDWNRQNSQHSFDLTRPMFHTVLHKLSDEHFVWYLNQHHLITDGWSVAVVYKKVAETYAKLVEIDDEMSVSFPAFEAYRQHEHDLRQAGNRQQIEAYWQKKLKELPATPKLYGKENRSGSTDSAREHVDLGTERSTALRALTQEPDLRAWTQDLSLFNIFATILSAFLYRISNQQSIAFGTPAHNRIRPAYKQSSGLFIELFPITASLREEETFSSLFSRLQTEILDFLKYAQPGAATSELNRGFNVVLNYINANFSDFAGLPMTSDWVHPDHVDPAHLFRLQVHDFDNTGNIHLAFDLHKTVFTEAQRRDIPRQFLRLIDAFIKNRTQTIQSTPLTDSTRINQDSVQTVSPTDVIGSFERQVADKPHQTALEWDGLKLDFVSINTRANQLAHYLKLRPGTRVAVYLRRSPDFVVSVLAILKSGAVLVPVDINHAPGKSEAILEDVRADALITHSSLAEKVNVQQGVSTLLIDRIAEQLKEQSTQNLLFKPDQDSLAYIMYTSGSTGRPKGVMVSRGNLAHYIGWAASKYTGVTPPIVPFFTATGFDLTITSLFLPLVTGGKIIIYPEPESGPDLTLFEVLKDNLVTFIKLTPSHLSLLHDEDYTDSNIQCMVIGGEDLKWHLAAKTQERFGGKIRLFNEYGPTEATVGCVVGEFDPAGVRSASVPIGRPITGTTVYVLDSMLNLVPDGVTGELHVSGPGLAKGYWGQEALTKEKFIPNPFQSGELMYKTGDLVRMNDEGDLEYLGREDEQVKISGRRIELGEIEAALNQIDGIDSSIADLRTKKKTRETEVSNCKRCGLPSNYPNISFNEDGICDLCESFEGYQKRVQKYFKNMDDLRSLFEKSKNTVQNSEYDCIALLSGGKDSTYALARLVDMGLKVLAFTLDNGYISDQAKDNIRKVVKDLGVDHMFGTTPAMNEIFVDSLQRHCNVCDGCFKTIYTLSLKVALEKNIPYIVTGLSRGQFFETRLTEELFRDDHADLGKIDEIILQARKSYHRVDDAVKRLIDVSTFENDEVFEKVKFVDFYRYTDVSLDEMLDFLDKKMSWVRPTDTGRSTNCLINQAGIYVHKKERGYSNYAFPYSWDVRLGHKTREASLDEINEVIDEPEVARILDEIGYTGAQAERKEEAKLVAYYTSAEPLDESEIRHHLEAQLPDYMIPFQFVHLKEMPLTENGKIDKSGLPLPDSIRPVTDTGYVAPRSDIESILADIWSEVLNIDRIGVFDKFLELGGNSLAAIRVISRTNEAFELDLPHNLAFNKPTIAAFADYVRETMMQLLEEED